MKVFECPRIKIVDVANSLETKTSIISPLNSNIKKTMQVVQEEYVNSIKNENINIKEVYKASSPVVNSGENTLNPY